MIIEPELAVGRLMREHPDWLPVLDAAAAVAARVESAGGEFAGAWVVAELERRGIERRVPNLRLLAAYGLIAKSGPSTSGGRRAYYCMPEREGVERALEDWRGTVNARVPRKLRFIASGESTEPPDDVGRRSGEMTYEPSSWR